jgi:transketolase
MSISPKELACWVRRHVLCMVASAKASHVGGCLSSADILAVLYSRVLRFDPTRPDWPDRDRFILSKGHAAAALYAVLCEQGFFSTDELSRYCADDSNLTGHASHRVPGVEFSTGSLGHGLSVGCGLALAAARSNAKWRTYVLLSDGELDEGSVWEAALFAGHHGLSQLIAIVDYNGIQSLGRTKDILDLEPLAEKWRAFRWKVREIDGHDLDLLEETLAHVPVSMGHPTVVIARTVKGKGVPFMEDDLAWHYRSPNPEQLTTALASL